jgi:hypothetical protein
MSRLNSGFDLHRRLSGMCIPDRIAQSHIANDDRS